MNKHWQYAKYVARHKWFVLVAGRKTKAPLWRLLMHDWSKLTPAEWGPYATFFYAPRPPATRPGIAARRKAAFDRAWLHHQHRNPHHWQHWVLRNDNGNTDLLQMPESFVREMVADWLGAGRAITGKWDVWAWYAKNCNKIMLNAQTAMLVEHILSDELYELQAALAAQP